jgi:hypothetical protein
MLIAPNPGFDLTLRTNAGKTLYINGMDFNDLMERIETLEANVNQLLANNPPPVVTSVSPPLPPDGPIDLEPTFDLE